MAHSQRSSVSRLLQPLIPPLVWNFLAGLVRPRRRTRTALDRLDERLDQYITTRSGYFVELGANDGVTQSNTYWLERERGWRGLLVEPALNRYFDLRRNRSPENDFACAACVPFGYVDQFVAMHYGNLMSRARELDSDLADPEQHFVRAQLSLSEEEESVVFGALARPLQDLLDNADAPRVVDFLSLDVEGSELAVLQGIDHKRTRFRFMLIECRDLSPLSAYLEGHGYRYLARLSHHDHLFTADGS